MISITFYIDKQGNITFATDNPFAHVIGELLTIDIAHMADFLRALLISPVEEYVVLDACSIQVTANTVEIKHLYATLPTVILSKPRALRLLDSWEQIIHNPQAMQVIQFEPDDFGTVITPTHKTTQPEL